MSDGFVACFDAWLRIQKIKGHIPTEAELETARGKCCALFPSTEGCSIPIEKLSTEGYKPITTTEQDLTIVGVLLLTGIVLWILYTTSHKGGF